ncbi:MAG: PAS domain-containing protein, partial [Chloroflexi bacterium]|nr:PAS domain-containing protein [Chloroflexota bacterium]
MNELDFDKLLDAMPDAVLVADMESRIVYANASVHALLGWAPEALIGQSLHTIQPERLHDPHDIGFG